VARGVPRAGPRHACAVDAVVAWSNPPRRGSAFQAPAGMGLRLERVDAVFASQLQRFVPRSLGFSRAQPVWSSGF
jgi:two-component system cell cycle response regulator